MNVGFYLQVFAIEANDSGQLTAAPRTNAAVKLSKIDVFVSGRSIALGSVVDLTGTLVATDGTATGVKVRYYDGDPDKDGRLIGMHLIPRVVQGTPYPIAKACRATTCGVHQFFAVLNKGKGMEVVRRAQPVRVLVRRSDLQGDFAQLATLASSTFRHQQAEKVLGRFGKLQMCA